MKSVFSKPTRGDEELALVGMIKINNEDVFKEFVKRLKTVVILKMDEHDLRTKEHINAVQQNLAYLNVGHDGMLNVVRYVFDKSSLFKGALTFDALTERAKLKGWV